MNKINDFASHLEKINWKYLSLKEPLTENFIEKFQDYIDWRYLSINENVSLSNEFLVKFKNKLNIERYLGRTVK